MVVFGFCPRKIVNPQGRKRSKDKEINILNNFYFFFAKTFLQLFFFIYLYQPL